jgi:hypothetical protein
MGFQAPPSNHNPRRGQKSRKRSVSVTNWWSESQSGALPSIAGKDVERVLLQRRGNRAEVFFEAIQFGPAGNGNDPGFLRQPPGQSGLRGRDFLLPGEFLNHSNQRSVGFAIFFVAPWPGMAKIRGVEFCILIDFAREKALAPPTSRSRNSALPPRLQDRSGSRCGGDLTFGAIQRLLVGERARRLRVRAKGQAHCPMKLTARPYHPCCLIANRRRKAWTYEVAAVT